jgi:hypothetical protein
MASGSAVVAVGFFDLPRHVEPPDNPGCCCDFFVWAVGVTADGEAATVSFCDLAVEWGPLSDAFEAIDDWLSHHSACDF